MKRSFWWRLCAFVLMIPLFPADPADAADYPAPQRGEWTARDFRFHTGQVLPELKLA